MKSHVKRATEIINQLKRNDLTPARRIELMENLLFELQVISNWPDWRDKAPQCSLRGFLVNTLSYSCTSR